MTTTIDAYASKPWYVDHLAPVWEALGAAAGTFYASPHAWPVAAALRAATTANVGPGARPILTVGYSDMATVRQAGRTMLALGQHGAGQSYGDGHAGYPGGRRQDEVSLFLVPNRTAAAATSATYPDARVEVVGCPKLDRLPAARPHDGPPVIAVSTHWDARKSPESRSAWPHFRHTILRMGRSRVVLGHGHPRALGQLAPLYEAAGIEVVASFAEILERADVYVCDNSSSLFEFAASDRPVVVLNAPGYRRDVHHGLRFWEAASVGVNVDHARDLEAAIDRALARRPDDEKARVRALELVYQPLRGGSALAAAALVDWAARIDKA